MKASRLCSFVVGLLGALGVFSSAPLAKDTLLVGNSFILSNAPYGVHGVLSGLCDAQGGFEGADFTDLSRGGYTLSGHAQDALQDGSSLNTALVSGDPTQNDWTSVVLQEQSQTAGFHIADNPLGPGYMWDESLVAAEALNGLVSDRGAATVFLMTWGYREGDASIPEHLFDGYPDFLTMQAALEQGYEMYADGFTTQSRVVFVSPAGLAFKKVYEDLVAEGVDPLAGSTPFTDLYSGDGRHPALQGSYLAGCVLYATLSGRDPSALSWAPPGIPESRGALLREAASAVTVRDPYTPRVMPWGEVFRYPFMVDFAELGLEGEEAPHLGASDLRPTARLDRVTPPLSSLTLGQGAADAGRLGVFEGGLLRVTGAFELGRAGSGQLDLKGGEVDAGSLTLAGEPGSHGALLISGGSLETERVEAGQGSARFEMSGGVLQTLEVHLPFILSGGTWRIEGRAEASEGLTLEKGGTLSLSLGELSEDAAQLSLGDQSVLAGTLSLWLPEGAPLYTGTYVLLEGEGLDLNMMNIDTASLDAEGQVSWQVEAEGDTKRLILTVVGGAQRPGTEGDALEPLDVAPSEEPEEDAGPEPDLSNERSDEAVEPPTGGEPSPPSPPAEDEGCQASERSSGGGTPLLVMLIFGLFGLFGRYRATRSQASMIRLG